MRIEELEGQESLFARDSGSGKTSSGRSAAGEILQRVKNGLGQTFKKSSKRSSKLKNHTFMLLDLRQDAGNILGPCWEYDPVWLGSLGTLNTSECPKDVVESSLWQILLDTVPSRYWLSQKACRGMLRRADCRGKLLPKLLEIALSMQGGLIPPGPIPDELKAYPALGADRTDCLKDKAAEERTAAARRFFLCGLQKWKEVQNMETISFEVKIIKHRTIRITLTGRIIGCPLYGYGTATGGTLDLPYNVPLDF